MGIRLLEQRDIPQLVGIWNEAVETGEVVLSPMTEQKFHQKFEGDPNYDPALSFVWEEDGAVVGFIIGMAKKVFLPGETYENTPGLLTCVFVRKAYRGRGIGQALVRKLEDLFRESGKKVFACNGDANPIDLDWIVPGTPWHDHNNAPGMDTECPGYPFLLSMGFQEDAREIAMYLNLAEYTPWAGLKQKQEELLAQGIYTGRYDPSLHYDYDRMCDRVGKEYWRNVIRSELECHRLGKPNTDIHLIPNGTKVPDGPRPLLVATHDRHIVAFTGPVDKQESGRGWFCGIFTDPEYERKGIASVLFNLLMQEFIAEGARFSTLFTGVENHAQRIYLRAGFRIVRQFAIMHKEL